MKKKSAKKKSTSGKVVFDAGRMGLTKKKFFKRSSKVKDYGGRIGLRKI